MSLNWKDNWSTYLKLGAVAVGIIVWAVTAQARLDTHVNDTRDTIKLLILICKNTAPKQIDQLECYNTIERR